MKFMRPIKFILLFLSGAVAVTAFAGDDSQTVSFSQTPAAVQKTIQAQTAGGTMGEIDKSFDAGETVYDVDLTATNGDSRDFSVADDGTLLSVEVPFAGMPAAAQSAIKMLVGDGSLESIDKNLDDLEINYDIEVAAKDGSEKSFTIADDGTLLSQAVALTDTPDAVQKKIATQLNGGKLDSIDENFDDTTNFDVEMTAKDGGKTSFTVEMDGNLSSREVTLNEIPPAAQRSIKNAIGDGKILRIDRSFARDKGVMPFEVQGRKNGKPFDFSVGPRGRFLGMDN